MLIAGNLIVITQRTDNYIYLFEVESDFINNQPYEQRDGHAKTKLCMPTIQRYVE